MKKILLTAAALAALATPAWAATHHRVHRTQAAQETYANEVYAPRNAEAVMTEGQFAGQDPDSFIRLQLLRDPNLPAN